MLSRRKLMQQAVLFAGSAVLGCSMKETQPSQRQWWMPDETGPHKRTWMAFGASQPIWGSWLLPAVQRDLGVIARTIAQYEPVTMLVRADEVDLARELTGAAVELVLADMDDLWIRDTGPVFVVDHKGRAGAIDFNFNGWGEKQVYRQDAEVAAFVAQQAETPLISTDLVLEGGCIEVDGQGTAIITESCVLNNNRNPGMTKAEFEAALKPLLGLEKIIWLPGIRGMDITDGHTDFYARFARPGVVFAGYEPNPASFDHEVTKAHLEILRTATDAQGKSLNVIVLEAPTTIRETYATEDFAPGYMGFYACNNAIILQEFGDATADAAAKQSIQSAFPERAIIPINIDAIAAGGGTIHCVTQQEPLI